MDFGAEVEILTNDERQIFRIVGEDEADPKRGLIAPYSPLGHAGRTPDCTRSVVPRPTDTKLSPEASTPAYVECTISLGYGFYLQSCSETKHIGRLDGRVRRMCIAVRLFNVVVQHKVKDGDQWYFFATGSPLQL